MRFDLTLIWLLSLCACAAPGPERAPLAHQAPLPVDQQNAAYRWLEVAQEAAARDVDANGARPTVQSRQFALWATAMYDAWTAYDEHAAPVYASAALRRPREEHTLENKRVAVSYASFRALIGMFPHDEGWLAERLREQGFDPSNATLDPTRAAGVGNLAAQAVLEARRRDGSNSFGDEPGSSGGPYSDTTGYTPVNSPERIVDPDRWQPITFTRPDGTRFTPGFLTPHWFKVAPLLLERADQFRPGPPPTTRTDDALLHKQTDEVLAYNRGLSPREKAIVEFMRDGPRSTGQSGHWLRFAQDVSRRDRHTLDDDVKLYFAVAGVAFDAFISCWETKRFYDSSRPWTLVRHYYAGQRVSGWAGPVGGVIELPAEQWHPYSPYSFITPPFPGYTSGHATVSGACAKLLELFTGSDHYGAVEKRRCCELTETHAGDAIALELPTFSSTAEMAARSRALGGYHISIDNDVGLRVGREIACWSWPRYQALWDGAAR